MQLAREIHVVQLRPMVFLVKTYDVSPYDSQRSHPSMDLGEVGFVCPVVQTAVKCQDCKIV